MTIEIIGCHAEGEVGDVIVAGVDPPPGATVWEQSRWIAGENGGDGRLRNLVLNEPRGGVFRHVNLLVSPINPRADAAFIIMEPADTPPMSGSNAICVATVLLEAGILPMAEPETRLTLEAPGGLVEVRVACSGAMARRVTIRNIPSFADRLGALLEVEGIGTLTVDTAFGGDSFVIADARALGFALTPDEARDLAETGMRLTRAADEQLGFSHPTLPGWRHFSFAQIAAPVSTVEGVKTGRNAVAIRPGKIDRSPCGTGCSARMAALHARGELAAGEPFHGLSLIGSEFRCRIVGETLVGDRPAILPEISGRAWLTGRREILVDPDDLWPEGYRMSDTWPGA